MFDRRSFLLKSGTAAALASAAALTDSSPLNAQEQGASAPPYFEIVTFRYHFVQGERLVSWMEKRATPLLQKHKFGVVGFFMVEVGPHVPALIEILTYPSLAEREVVRARLVSDSDWGAAVTELEKDGPPYYRRDSALLRATSFSPLLKASAAGDPAHKIYELRFYEASTQRQLNFMHDRFYPGEIEVFHQCGIDPILYGDIVIGPNMPCMVYLIPFESEAHREKAWAAFRAHPDWQKIAGEWMQKAGELARNISSTILVPTAFSALR